MATHAEASRMILRRTQLALRGLPVVYICEKGKQLSFKAVPASLDAALLDAQDALSTQARTLDWLVNPDQLLIRGKRFEPEYGHQIIHMAEGFKRTWELLPSDVGNRWAYTDGMRTFAKLTMTLMEVKPL